MAPVMASRLSVSTLILAHSGPDAALNLFYGHAVRLANLAAVLVDDGDELLRNGARTVHHEVTVRELLVNLLDARHGEYVTGRLLRELVGSVARADGDGERVDARAVHEVDGLRWVGQELRHRELALSAVPVFLVPLAGLERTEAAELSLDRDAEPVRHVDHLASDRDVVLVARGRLSVGLERPVHHDAREAHANRADARVGGIAVVLVHDNRDLGIELGSRQHQVLQEKVVRELPSSARGLDDDRALCDPGRLHDGLDLLHVVDVESADPVAVLGRVVEEGTHGNERHERPLFCRAEGILYEPPKACQGRHADEMRECPPTGRVVISLAPKPLGEFLVLELRPIGWKGLP